MRYQINHQTVYRYHDSVALCHNLAYLLLRDTPQQTCLSSYLTVQPMPMQISERRDYFDNRVSYFTVQVPHHVLTVTAYSQVQTQPAPPLPPSPDWEEVRDHLASDNNPQTLAVREYILPSPFVPTEQNLRDYGLISFQPQRPLLDAMTELTARIYHEFSYDPHFTTIITPLHEVFEHKRGVCQDFAHLAIASLRQLGLAARYVSGYLETLPPPGQDKLRGADASHAWLSVYLPDYGWVDFDPTNNQRPNEQYITTAWGRDYGDVTPLKGIIFGGGEHQLNVAVDVERLT